MRNLIWLLIALSAICILLAVVTGLTNNAFFGIAPEGYSNGSTNLALLAIALLLINGKKGSKK
jgi:hypothetical protein